MPPLPASGFAGLMLGAALAVGWTVRERRAYAAGRASRPTEQAVAEERLRIARELHDIVAHSMSLIAVKAAVANHVAEARPQEARDALRVIEATSRGALAEMRRALGVLRDGAPDAPAPGSADLPGLADLAALADRAATAGVQRAGPAPAAAELPEAVGLVGLPDRAGGADQRGQARRRRPGARSR